MCVKQAEFCCSLTLLVYRTQRTFDCGQDWFRNLVRFRIGSNTLKIRDSANQGAILNFVLN